MTEADKLNDLIADASSRIWPDDEEDRIVNGLIDQIGRLLAERDHFRENCAGQVRYIDVLEKKIVGLEGQIELLYSDRDMLERG
jgi:hypothetical protein